MASLPETQSAKPVKLKADLIRLCERAFLILLSALAIVRIGPVVSDHPQLALFLFSEIVGVILLLLQRRGDWTVKAYPIVVAMIGTGVALCVVPEGRAFISNAASLTLIMTGATFALGAKLFLGRSFGVIPANRGVKSMGVYRIVRHPMYLGYMIHHVGFLLIYFSWWNLAVYAVAWLTLYLRTVEEEKFLRQDEAYRQYAAKVRYKLVPGLV